MTPSRAAWYLGGVAVLAGWLAAAANQAGVREARHADARLRAGEAADVVRAEQLAADIETQARRLRARLAVAPAPTPFARNPFAFHVRRAPTPAPKPAFDPDDDPLMRIEETFPLTLSGVAEIPGEDGTVRIAILSGLGDVFHARVGDAIVARYVVTAVGADAVELNDLETGRTIRLGLR